MELMQLYDNMFNQSIGQISRGDIEIDRQIDDDSDRRRGLTLLIRPNDEIKARVEAFQDELIKIDGGQYYQPPSDQHVTAAYSGDIDPFPAILTPQILVIWGLLPIA